MKTLSEFLMQEIIDSRDIIERVEALKSDCLGLKEDIKDATKGGGLFFAKHLKFIKSAVEREIALLCNFRNECENYTSEFEHGEIIIGYHYFEEYCRECAHDWGLLPNPNQRDFNPICNFINWSEYSEYLKHDYSEFSFNGYNYYIRMS